MVFVFIMIKFIFCHFLEMISNTKITLFHLLFWKTLSADPQLDRVPDTGQCCERDHPGH